MRYLTSSIYWLLLCFWLVKPSSSAGQYRTVPSISGTVTDVKTGNPLAFAVVYFANTALGTYTNSDGTFLLQDIPRGKFNLIVSLIGYKSYSTTLVFENNEKRDLGLISLESETTLLNEVVVKAKGTRRKHYEEFRKHFIGQTYNARFCTIENPYDVILDYDESAKILKAHASKPIEIINRALGYKIYYTLKVFKMDYVADELIMSGIPRFEEIKPKNSREKRKWARARFYAYFGSVNHLMRSLKRRTLEEDHFTVYKDDYFTQRKMTEDSLFVRGSMSEVNYRGKLSVYFSGGYTPTQTSILLFKERVVIYENGYYDSPLSIKFDGYLGWRDRIADMVPLEYQPETFLGI